LQKKSEIIAPIKNFSRRYKISAEYEDLAISVLLYHHCCELTLDNENLLWLLEQLDGFRRPQRLYNFLAACNAILSVTQPAINNVVRIKQAYDKISAIDTQDIIAAGYQGKEIGIQLRIKRLKVLSCS
jgi:tRNA nucleotidyltransferase (CCA-adding enzyme)